MFPPKTEHKIRQCDINGNNYFSTKITCWYTAWWVEVVRWFPSKLSSRVVAVTLPIVVRKVRTQNVFARIGHNFKVETACCLFGVLYLGATATEWKACLILLYILRVFAHFTVAPLYRRYGVTSSIYTHVPLRRRNSSHTLNVHPEIFVFQSPRIQTFANVININRLRLVGKR